MTPLDVSKLSYSELVELRKQLEQQIDGKREEELKTLADGFAKKIEAAGFSIAEAIEALAPYNTSKGRKTAKPLPTATVHYRDPVNPENTWSGRGRPATWLANYEANGRSREEFKV